MNAEPQKEHQWLQKLVGEWTYEIEAVMGPDQPPTKFKGTESVRSLGGFWVLCEGRGESPGGGTSNTLMTLGYDPKKKSFVGTFIGSMSSYMWIYETGSLDAAESALTFECDGPDFEHEGKLKRYRDTIEWKSDDHRVLRAQMQGDDGTWTEMMVSHYRRTK